MTAPAPQVPLSGHCSVLDGETLYAYSPDAFQYLPLQTNATWKELPNGVPVSGASCVLQTGVGIWVIGGAPTNSTSDYTGLQKYTFKTNSWETITPQVSVTQDRLGHTAVFLQDLNSILVYAGTQGSATTPSTETFLIETISPYTVHSYGASNTPVVAPLLLNWDSSSAITLGGTEDDTSIYRFQQYIGWQPIFPSLSGPLKSSEVQKAALVQGSDNSRVLQLYDFSVTPTNLTQVILQNGHGKPAQQGRYIGQAPTKKRKRDTPITINSWPTYNNTNAPNATRTGFALAANALGVVSISGGGPVDQSVALFSQTQNTWVNTTWFFGASADQKPLVTSSSMTSPIPTATGAPVTLPTQPAFQADAHPRASLILGATLGAILGLIALLIIVLLALRWRRRKLAEQRAADMEVKGNDSDDEKDRMSIIDRGDPFNKETVGPTYPASQHTLSVYEGQYDHGSSAARPDTRGSDSSTTMLVPRRDGDTYEMSTISDRQTDPAISNIAISRPTTSASNTLQVPGAGQLPKRTSGWSRYFSGNDLLASNRNSARDSSVRDSSVEDSSLSRPQSQGKDLTSKQADSQGPLQLPPLDMGQQFHETRISRQVTGTAPLSPRPVSDAPSTYNDRPRTVSSTFSTVQHSIAPSVWSQDGHEPASNWTPVTDNGWSTTPRIHDTGHTSISGSPTNSVPRFSKTNAPPPRVVSNGLQIMNDTVSEEQGSRQKAAKVLDAPALPSAQQAVVQEDMSWLNLGANGARAMH